MIQDWKVLKRRLLQFLIEMEESTHGKTDLAHYVARQSQFSLQR